MLGANNCRNAFWMGNLRHKGIDGKEVCSQVPLAISADSVESEAGDPMLSDLSQDELDKDAEDDSKMDEDVNEDPTLALSP